MAGNSEWLAHKLHTLEQQVQSLSRGTGLGHSSLHGGTIIALDDDGLPVAEFGSDGGGGGVLYLDGPVPPVPSTPILEQGIGTVFVRWDGLYKSEDVGEPTEAPIDFDRIEVHATTDPELDVWDEDTLAGSITQRGGGVVMIRGWEIDDVVYVRLVCRSLADKVSAASDPAEVVVEGIDIASIVNELDAANVELANLDGTMFAANAELDALRIQFKNLDASIINTDDGTLSEALDDARQALEDVRGQAQSTQDAQDVLREDLDTVRTSVDGKSRITQSTSTPPQQYDGSVGDRWERMSSMGSGGSLISNWRWSGTVWVSTLLSDAVIANLDAAKIGTGYLDAARLKAGSIAADRLMVGVSQNLVVDYLFKNADINAARATSAWRPVQEGVDGLFQNVNGESISSQPLYLTSTGGFQVLEARIPVDPTVSWAMAVDVRVGPGAAPIERLFMSLVGTRADGTHRFLTRLMVKPDGSPEISSADGWVRLSGDYVFSSVSDVVQVSPRIVVTQGGGGGGTYSIRAPYIAQRVSSTIIEDGAITTDKVAANAIGARAIAADAIEAGKIAASAITARELAANSVNAEKIVGLSITADELAANSISTSKIVAEAVTADKIVANAITTGKLNALAVTADKVAANAITADKIAANAITAGKIDADAINGKTITGATVRTNPTGARVELNPTGLSAWNSAGTRTFNVNQATGQVEAVGSVYSGLPGQQRVILDDSVYNVGLTYTDPEGVTYPAAGAGIIFGQEGNRARSARLGTGVTAGGTSAVYMSGPRKNTQEGTLALHDSGHAQLYSMNQDGGVFDATVQTSPIGQAVMRSRSGALALVNQWGDASLRSSDGAQIVARADGSATLNSTGGGWVTADSDGGAGLRTGGTGGGWLALDPGSGGGVDIAHVNSSNIYQGRIQITGNRIDTSAPTSIVYTTDSGGYLAVSGDSVGGFVRSTSVYNRTYGSAANVHVTSGGNLGRSTSARRYKVDEQVLDPAEYADALLSVPFKSWLDKGQIEQRDKLLQFRRDNPYCPTPADLAETEDVVQRSLGAVAEDFVDAGLEQFVTFDQYGRVDGLQYDRVGVALLPIIKGMQERIDRLEADNRNEGP